MRLIDADELIEELIKCESSIYPITSELILGVKSGYRKAIVQVEHAPTIEAEPKWISVTERLPEKMQRIIGTFDDGFGDVLVGEVCFYPQLLIGGRPLTAWMPLPEAYKGELK